MVMEVGTDQFHLKRHLLAGCLLTLLLNEEEPQNRISIRSGTHLDTTVLRTIVKDYSAQYVQFGKTCSRMQSIAFLAFF